MSDFLSANSEILSKKDQGETPKDIFCYIEVQNAYPFRQGAHIEGYLSKTCSVGFGLHTRSFFVLFSFTAEKRTNAFWQVFFFFFGSAEFSGGFRW